MGRSTGSARQQWYGGGDRVHAGRSRLFYRGAFRPESATLIVVGDTTPDRVLPLLEKASARGRRRRRRRRRSRCPWLRSRRGADLPGRQARCASRRFGRTIGARATPDFFPIQVMNTVLGGSFSSRLNLNLREKRGYTYGASSGFDMRLTPGPFSAQAECRRKTSDH
jgi:zinc protease